MKKVLLAGVAGVALVAGAPAHAADVGVRPTYKAAPVAAPVPVFTWTGCYLGGHVGGGFGRKDFDDTSTTAGDNLVSVDSARKSLQVDTSGVLGGGQVGCDWQWAPNWLVGIQGSGSDADIKGDAHDPFFSKRTFHVKTDWFADVTGRVGVVWDRVQVYGKGGVAWAGDQYHVIDTPGGHLDATETRTGFVAGAGVEWAFWNNLSAFLEYDFYGFGHRSLLFTCTSSSGASCGTRGPEGIKQDFNVVKFGLNWRFNFGKAPIGKAPVVAKY